MKNKKTHIISLGGSIIAPDKINVNYIKKIRKLILSFVKKGHRFVLVTGGGNTGRLYNEAARKITKINDKDLDWIGIAATRMNAELIRAIFSDLAYEKVIYNPTKKIKTNKKIIVGAGYIPGCSSDKDTVLLAKQFKAKEVINLFDLDYVYDRDPKKYKKAKPLKEISWKDYMKIVGTKWSPRLSTPFDPEASKLAKKLGIKVVVIKGTNLNNLKKYLSGQKFKGTVIK